MTYQGLQNLIILDSAKPALDSHLVDCTGFDLVKIVQKIYDVIILQNCKLFEMGIVKYDRAIVANKHVIDEVSNYFYWAGLHVSPIIDNNSSNNIYILIKEINGRSIINPPYNQSGTMMSWDEFLLKIYNDENPRLMCDYPYLQAKLESVDI